MSGDDDDSGGEAVRSSPEGYCSLSEVMVTPDSASGFGGSSDAIAAMYSRPRRRVKEGDAVVVWWSWPPGVERFPVVGAGVLVSSAELNSQRHWPRIRETEVAE